MLLDVLSVLGGLGLLVLGAELLVGGASTLALRARLPAAVVGVTVVAWGTSMPELVVSLNAALTARPDVSVGNVVGSNIYNIALILGLSTLIRSMVVARQTLRLDTPAMLLAAVLLWLFAWDGTLGPLEGGVLLALMVLHTGLLYRLQGSATEDAPAEEGLSARLPTAGVAVLVAVSIGVLGLGARFLIDGAVALASAAGISERVIGLTLVALGTSLPELFASVIAAIRGRDDIAVSNVVGSNLFNVAGILGITALVTPLKVHPRIQQVDLLWVLGLSVLLLVAMVVGRERLGRAVGVLLLVLCGLYTLTVGG